MKASKVALIGLALSVPALGAVGTGLPLTEPERQAFRTELRAALLADPSPIEAALNPPPIDLYADDKAADLALIEAHGAALFSTWPAPNRIAFFTKESCDDCIKAEAELVEITKNLGWEIITHPADGALAQRLSLPDAPFYVLPDMFLRGWMPAPALERYLIKRAAD